MVVSCTGWLSIRLDLLSSLFVTIVAVAAILITENPGEWVQTYSDDIYQARAVIVSLQR